MERQRKAIGELAAGSTEGGTPTTQQRKGKWVRGRSSKHTTAFGSDRERDQTRQSQDPGTEETASRWMCQVSSSSSVSHSSRQGNDPNPEGHRCQVFRVMDIEPHEPDPVARIDGSKAGRAGPTPEEAECPPGPANRARMIVQTMIIVRNQSAEACERSRLTEQPI
jgi:hypothetical protein